jgi:predicted nuclease of predicted toxin-antitoxin system
LAAASDRAILDFARREDLTVVTLDSDFHALLATSGATGPSAIRLRVEGLKGVEACELISSVLERARRELESGVLSSANRTLLRIKRLPILS